MKKAIPIFGIMGVDLFFCISSIIGYKYNGIADSKVYIVYCIAVAVLNLVLCLSFILQKESKITIAELFMLSFPIIIFIIFLITGMLKSNFNPIAKTFFEYFLLWSVPAIYIAIYVNRSETFIKLTKWFDLVMLIFSFSIFTTCIIPFLQGVNFSSLGGATYQSASYIAAFAYGINLYYLFLGENHERFDFTKNKVYRYICFPLIFIQLAGIILSGGRGGIVLATIYTIYILFLILKDQTLKKVVSYFLFLIFFVGLIALIVPVLLQNEVFARGFKRVFQFISPEGTINWEGTSNRDEAYSAAIDLIEDKPIFGYGLYGFWDVSGYPHNIILEILLNGGIVYLIATFFIFIFFLYKLKKLIKVNAQNRLLFILFLYPITMLMFSGTYMINSTLWFVLTLVFTYKIKYIQRP